MSATQSNNNSPNSQLQLDECNVFVKYLPPDFTDDELHKLFQSYGKIVSSKIMVDQETGKSLGYGFVRYTQSTASQNAIKGLNGHKIQNKRLLCKLANLSPTSYNLEYAKNPILNSQIPSNNLYIKPLRKDTTEEDLRQLFEKFGNIVDCKVMVDKKTGLSRQIGFVRFENKDHAIQAITQMNNYRLDPTLPPLTVKYADTKEQKSARKALRQKSPSPTDQFNSSTFQTTYFYPMASPYVYPIPPEGFQSPNFNMVPQPTFPTYPYEAASVGGTTWFYYRDYYVNASDNHQRNSPTDNYNVFYVNQDGFVNDGEGERSPEDDGFIPPSPMLLSSPQR